MKKEKAADFDLTGALLKPHRKWLIQQGYDAIVIVGLRGKDNAYYRDLAYLIRSNFDLAKARKLAALELKAANIWEEE